MNAISIVVLIFSVIGAADYLFGNRFGVGREFEKAFSLFGPMALSMLGMLVLAPAIGVWLSPVFEGFYRLFGIDPSIIPASFLANEMGGAPLAQSVCKSATIGNYNAFVVSSMMGTVISFTLPFALGVVKQEQRKELFFGLLCGIATIPTGCFAAGLVCGLDILTLLFILMPLIILAVLVAAGLIFFPKICIRGFGVFGSLMKAVAIAGLVCAVFTFLTKTEISPHFDTFENAAFLCVNACVTLSGALPVMFLAAKLLDQPLNRMSSRIGINGVSALAFLTCLATNVSSISVLDRMNRKGAVLNAAFAVSAGGVFGGHLAFTMAMDSRYVAPMMVGKLVSGLFAVILALLIYKDGEEELTA